jgi:hypothetical protein
MYDTSTHPTRATPPHLLASSLDTAPPPLSRIQITRTHYATTPNTTSIDVSMQIFSINHIIRISPSARISRFHREEPGSVSAHQTIRQTSKHYSNNQLDSRIRKKNIFFLGLSSCSIMPFTWDTLYKISFGSFSFLVCVS